MAVSHDGWCASSLLGLAYVQEETMPHQCHPRNINQ